MTERGVTVGRGVRVEQAARYRTIVADPPWPMPETGKRNHNDSQWWERFSGASVKLPYETMTVDQIRALPVCDLADEGGAHLYLWTTNRFLEDAYSVMRGWGFQPSQLLVWAKPPMGVGFGGFFTTTTEFILFGRRGATQRKYQPKRQDSSWWSWSRPYENGHIAHSAKPDAFLDLVEQVSPEPRIELFARRQRLGWDTWGDEALGHVTMESA